MLQKALRSSLGKYLSAPQRQSRGHDLDSSIEIVPWNLEEQQRFNVQPPNASRKPAEGDATTAFMTGSEIGQHQTTKRVTIASTTELGAREHESGSILCRYGSMTWTGRTIDGQGNKQRSCLLQFTAVNRCVQL